MNDDLFEWSFFCFYLFLMNNLYGMDDLSGLFFKEYVVGVKNIYVVFSFDVEYVVFLFCLFVIWVIFIINYLF